MFFARVALLGLATLSWSAVTGVAQAPAPTLPYDHIHLNVPDPAAAANWYEQHFGGKRITEAPDRLMFGSTRFMFLRKADATAERWQRHRPCWLLGARPRRDDEGARSRRGESDHTGA